MASSSSPVGGIKHPAFQAALTLTRPAGRAETGRYLVEGADLVRQALASLSAVDAVFALDREAHTFAIACAARAVPLYALASAGLIAKLVGQGYETAVTAVAVVAQRVLPPNELLAAAHGGAPFVLAGAIKCVYDLSLWRLFSRVPLEPTTSRP